MKTESIMQRCRRLKRKATVLISSEHVGNGVRRPAARRAWKFATNVQNAIYANQLPPRKDRP